MSTLLIILLCVIIYLLARIVDNTTKPVHPDFAPVCDYEGEYATLPGVQHELARQRKRWFPDAWRISQLEMTQASMLRMLAEADAERVRWEAAHPGMNHAHYELTGYITPTQP